MINTYENDFICLAEYTSGNRYITIKEVCDTFGKAKFEMTFFSSRTSFKKYNTLQDLVSDLLFMSLTNYGKEISFLILQDIEEILSFLEKNRWTGDINTYAKISCL